MRRWAPLLEKGLKRVFGTTKVLQQVDTTCKTSKWVQGFGWVRSQVHMLRKLSCLVVNLFKPCWRFVGSRFASQIAAVWGLYNAIFARTDTLGNGQKRSILCDSLFYSQTHVIYIYIYIYINSEHFCNMIDDLWPSTNWRKVKMEFFLKKYQIWRHKGFVEV